MEKLKCRFGSQTEVTMFDWDKLEAFADTLNGITALSPYATTVVTNDFHLRAEPFIEAAKNAVVSHIMLTTTLYSNNQDRMFYEAGALMKNSGTEEYKKHCGKEMFPEFLHELLPVLYSSIAKGQWEKVSNNYTC